MSTPDEEQREAEFEEWNERTAGGTKPTDKGTNVNKTGNSVDISNTNVNSPTPSATTKSLEDIYPYIWHYRGAIADLIEQTYKHDRKPTTEELQTLDRKLVAAIDNYTTRRVIEELENFEWNDPHHYVNTRLAELRESLKGGIDADQ